MSNTIKGRVHEVMPVENTERNGKSFSKQRVVFDCTRVDQDTGERYENFPMIEFNERMFGAIANLNPGDRVEVAFALNGRYYTNANNEEKHFTTIRGFRIDVLAPAQSGAAPVGRNEPPMPTEEPAFDPEPKDDGLPF